MAVVTVAYRADNMVTGLTANILAAGLTSYLARVLSGGGRPIAIHLTPLPPWPIPGLADIPLVGPLLFALPPLTYLAIAGCVALAFFLGRTQAGLTLRATGESPETVLASGGAVPRAHGSRSSPAARSLESAARCSPCSRSEPSPTA